MNFNRIKWFTLHKTRKIMKSFILSAIVIILTVLHSNAQQVVNTGDKAPLFTAIDDNGSKWTLKDHIGKNYVVVYFYPAAMTGGCTKQACAYRDNKTVLEAQGIEVVGVSGDNPEGLRLFKKAENLNFTLLSDEKGEIAKAFGVPVSGGGTIKRTVEGSEFELLRGVTAKRWTFVIGKDGKIIYKNEAVNAEKDTEEVLNFIKAQTAG